MNANSVFIEIKTPNIKKLMFVIDTIKQNNLDFELMEEPSNFLKADNQNLLRRQLGRKGMDVLRLLAEGKKYTEIAIDTGITIDGVRYYVKKIFRSLGVNNGRDAIRKYLTELQ